MLMMEFLLSSGKEAFSTVAKEQSSEPSNIVNRPILVFARFARAVFLPMLRIQPRISSFPPEVKTFDEYTSGIESFMSLTASRIEELRGNMMLVMDPTFISILTNSFYGGQLGPDKSKKTEFTSTEDRLIEIISEGLNRMLESAWKDLMPINLNVQGREVNPQFVSFVDGSELVIICSFVVQLPGMDAANFDVIYPLQTLKPIASLLRSKVQSDKVEDDVDRICLLTAYTLDVRVEALLHILALVYGVYYRVY